MKSGFQGSNRKGQLVFEFIIATMLFLTIVIYTINLINITALQYSEGHVEDVTDSMVWQLSEQVMKTPGHFSGGLPVKTGIAKSWPVLNSTLISELNSSCKNDYFSVLESLNIDPRFHGMNIEVYSFDGSSETKIMECVSVPSDYTFAPITRFGISETGELLKVVFYYW